jgi:VanZ family protein
MSTALPDRRRWPGLLALLGLAALALLAIVAAHFFEPHYWSRTAKDFIKTFHAPGFAVVALALLGLFRRQRLGRRSYFYAAVAAMLAGVVSELAQAGSTREADVGDLLRDAIGIGAGLGVGAVFDERLRARHGRGWLALLVLYTGAALVASFWGTLASAQALWARNAALPTLASFAHGWEDLLYAEAGAPTARRVARPRDWPATVDDQVLWVTSTGRRNTVLHLQPYPDWRAYRAFSFVAASADGNPHALNVKIRDTPPRPGRPRNSFNRRVEVTPTPQRVTIGFEEIAGASTERPFDFEHVDIVILSLRGENRRGTLLLDDFRLE